MRVGIDCRPLQFGPAGMKTYIRNLVPHLALMPEIDLVSFVSEAFPAPAPMPGVEMRSVAGRWWNNWVWTQWQLPRAVPPTIDVFHFPAYTSASRLSCARVVSVHDVSYAANPEWYPHAAGPLRQRFYRRSAVTADAVITISEFSKREICRVYPVPRERVFPIHLASGLASTCPSDKWNRHGQSGDYLLHVGDLHTRRNLATAVEAFSILALERPLNFVLIGKDLGAGETLRRRAQDLGCADRLLFLEDVPLAEMPHWYSSAAALVFLSLYEGFGLPLLEAMQFGCAVVAGSSASIPEVVGEGAWLVDPLNVREAASAVRCLMDQPETRLRLVGKGLQRSQQFHWEQTALRTAEVYRWALENRKVGRR